LTQVSNCTDR